MSGLPSGQQQGFGGVIGERPHAFAAPRRKNHCFHCSDPSWLQRLRRNRAADSPPVTDLLGLPVQLVEQIEQRLERQVTPGGFLGVAHEAGQVFNIFVLAIAVFQAAKDTQHLEVTLQAHQFIFAPEIAEIGTHRQASGAGL